MQTYHNKTVQQTAELLGTDVKTGLTHDEVKKRLHRYGKNELIEKKKKNIFIKFLEQFNDFIDNYTSFRRCGIIYNVNYAR